jgi:dephospho-CoA kinase
MKIIGLTGSIGMGKSAAAQMLREDGVPVFDADAAVHALYRGVAAPLVEAAFPGTTRDGVVDRAALATQVLDRPEALRRLEAIVHPLVAAARATFLTEAEQANHGLVVLDIPLLYETGGEGGVDAVLVVSAPEAVQKARVLARPGMTPEKLAAILAKQMPDSEKRRRADVVIGTGDGFETTRAALRAALRRFGWTGQGNRNA